MTERDSDVWVAELAKSFGSPSVTGTDQILEILGLDCGSFALKQSVGFFRPTEIVRFPISGLAETTAL